MVSEWCLAQVVLREHRRERADYMREWTRKNNIRVNAYRRARRPLRADIIKKQKREFYLKNRQAIGAYWKMYREQHADTIRERAREYRTTQGEILLQKKRADYAANKARYKATQKAWRALNPTWGSEYYEKNKAAINEKTRVSRAEQMANNPHARAAASMRSRVWALLKKAGARKIVSLGLTKAALKEWLEERFLPGMTWENYGTAWHVDHIVPCSAFDVTDPKQLRACFALPNMRPLWARENIQKADKVLRQSEFSLAPL